jgi:hypothetical protein
MAFEVWTQPITYDLPAVVDVISFGNDSAGKWHIDRGEVSAVGDKAVGAGRVIIIASDLPASIDPGSLSLRYAREGHVDYADGPSAVQKSM